MSIQNNNESVNISESIRQVKNAGVWGVAGSVPLADFSKRVNVMLCDAVRDRWNDVTADPLAADVNFLTTWYTNSKDVELIFRQNAVDKSTGRRSTDWRMQNVVTFVDVHLFVRSGGGDVEPDALTKVENALDKAISTYETVLIPNATCALTTIVPAGDEVIDDLQTLWHSVATVEVVYWKAKTI